MIRAFSVGFGGHLAQRLEALEDFDRPLGLLGAPELKARGGLGRHLLRLRAAHGLRRRYGGTACAQGDGEQNR